MKLISESLGIKRLGKVREDLVESIEPFERKAKSCALCDTPGMCCLDEHFVNVRITRLEAASIGKRLAELDEVTQKTVAQKAERAIEKFGLGERGDPHMKTYACPLFEPGLGCLVHDSAKPLPCIVHACYEDKNDLPPDNLLETSEQLAADLNERVYGRRNVPLPIPVAILGLRDRSRPA